MAALALFGHAFSYDFATKRWPPTSVGNILNVLASSMLAVHETFRSTAMVSSLFRRDQQHHAAIAVQLRDRRYDRAERAG